LIVPSGATLIVAGDVPPETVAGIAGALYVPQVGIINPGEFAPANSIEAVIWVAVMLPLFLSAIGLSIDGGVVFAARRELHPT